MKKWTKEDGTPFVVAMALSSGKQEWINNAQDWFKTRDGKKFISSLKVKDKKELFQLLKVKKNGNK